MNADTSAGTVEQQDSVQVSPTALTVKSALAASPGNDAYQLIADSLEEHGADDYTINIDDGDQAGTLCDDTAFGQSLSNLTRLIKGP